MVIQILFCRMYAKCSDAAANYQLDLPPLFQSPGIDRTAYVYLNSNQEVNTCLY